MTAAPKRSLDRRVLRTVLTGVIAAMLLVLTGVYLIERQGAHSQSNARLKTLAEAFDIAVSASIFFRDAAETALLMERLRHSSDILAAHVFLLGEQTPLASTPTGARPPAHLLGRPPGTYPADDDTFWFLHTLRDARDNPYATLLIRHSLAEERRQQAEYLLFFGVVTAIMIGAAVALSFELKRTLTAPLLALTAAVREIENTGNPALRAPKVSDDEVGALAESINRMLATLGERDQALRESERGLKEAQTLARLGNWNLDLATNTLRWSDEVAVLFEIDRTTFGASYAAFLDAIHPEDRATVDQAYTQSVKNGTPYAITHRLLMPDGRIKWMQERGETEYAPDGTPLRSHGTVQDVTDQTMAEAAIRASLHEKETLLREIHHRVKNNLQIISSLLHFQAKKVSDPAALAVFNEARERLRSMILVHEKLYNSKNLSEVDFADYLRALVDQLAQSPALSGQRVRFRLDAAPVRLPIEEALPAGMIVAELVTNILKYAYPGGRDGEAQVSLALVDGRVRLTVSDDGVGLPAGFVPDKSTSFGWQLIRNLTMQLDGTFALRNERGTHITVSFPHTAIP